MKAKSMAMTVVTALLLAVAPVQAQSGFTKGSPELKSAGSLAFGPQGILFIGDAKAATIYAIATGDVQGDASKASINIDGIDGKIASMLGTQAGQILINDVAVNPASGKAYLSVSRGRGANAAVVILRIDGAGAISELPLKDVQYSKALLPNAPEDRITGEGRRQQNDREFSITDISYVDGRVIVAGLTNEEFASNLRAIPFPFSDVDPGAGIEIFHGAHGRLETRSPVRTFVPITVGGDPQIVAAYTCTPLVRIPLKQLKPGEKVRGTTIAELGNRNRPLDIIAYEKDGKQYLLMANSARGVMKITTEDLTSRPGINERVNGIAGQPYETIESLKDVTQLAKLNDGHALILVQPEGSAATLRTIALP